MATHEIFIEGTDLAARRSGAEVRRKVDCALRSGRVVLDLSGVLSLSESYADELFGVLVEQYSLAWVFSRLDLRGARRPVLDTIRSAIRYRLTHRLTGSNERALAVAREALKTRRETHHYCAA